MQRRDSRPGEQHEVALAIARCLVLAEGVVAHAGEMQATDFRQGDNVMACGG